jgi:hypothetical protein
MAIPVKFFVEDKTKVLQLKLILPQETSGKNAFSDQRKADFPNAAVNEAVIEETAELYTISSPEEVTQKSVSEKSVTNATVAKKHFAASSVAKPQAPKVEVKKSPSVVAPSVNKTEAVASSVTAEAAIGDVPAPLPSAPETVVKNDVTNETASEEAVLKTSEIRVFEENQQVAGLPVTDNAAPIDVEEQFSPGEITSAGLKFTGFFRNRGGKYALKSSSGDMRILSSPGIPKISSAELSAEKISVSFRVLPSGNVPLSGIGVQGCPSENVANAVKVEISSWKFVVSDESSFLNFSCEASQ